MRKVAFTFLICFLVSTAGAQTAAELMQKSLTAMDNLKTARYTLDKIERLKNGKNISSELLVKLNVSPQKVYLYSITPNPGAEVLYVAGQNNGHVLINTNKFPFVTIKLKPDGSILRDDQHHTIKETGFEYLKNILKSNIAKSADAFYKNLSYEGIAEWKGKQYYKILIENRSFAYIDYTVQRGETVTSIANKYGVSDYMILANNPRVKDYDDVKPGEKLKVPNSYAKRIILYLDKINCFPLVQQIYDDKGLFEQYEMSGFVPNVTIDPAEFTPTYKSYHF